MAKAVKATTGITSASLGAKMYRTNIKNVPKVEGLKRDDGWIDMQVQFLIDKKSAGADHVVGWTVLKPGREPRAASAPQLRRVLHRAEGQGPHHHRQWP